MYSLSIQKFVGYDCGYAAGWKVNKNLELAMVAKLVREFAWSPIVYAKNYRSQANFMSADLIGIDIDGGMAIEDAVDRFSKTKCIIGTTRNHRKEKDGKPPCDRFRVVLALDAIVADPAQYINLVEWCAERIGVADKSCVDTARLFYPCKDIVFVNLDGLPIPSGKKFEVKRFDVRFNEFKKDRKRLNKEAEDFLDHGCYAEGLRNPTCFKVACQLLEMGESLEETIAIISSRTSLKEREIKTIVKSAKIKTGK